MKTVQCIIAPRQLHEVCRALVKAGVTDFAVTDAREFTCRKQAEQQPGPDREYAIELWPQVKIEITVAEDLIEGVLQTILRAATADQAGEGMIFVSQSTQAA